MTLEIDGHEFPFGDRKSESTDKTWVWDAPADLHDPATNFPVGSTVLVCLRTEGEVCRTPTPMLSVADVSAAEGEDLTFTARLSLPSTETVTVDWATSGGTAVSGTDFTEGMGTLTFEPGAREQTFTVSTTEDMTVEEDETFTVMLSNATVAISVATATGTIKNDDYPPLAWSTTLTVGNFSNVLFGYRPGTGSLSDDDFEFGSATYEVTNVGVYIDGREPDVTYVRLNVNLAGLPNILTLEIDGHQFPFDKTVRSTGTFWLWLAPTALHDPATNFPVGSTATVCLYTEGNACPTDGNAAPTFSSDATFDAAENQTVAGAVLATDSDAGDDVTGYEITGGADDAFFSIGATDGALTFDAAPNYEDAKDQDTGNTYVVVVTATSGAGEREKTATQTITVTVTDVDTEAPGKPDAPAVSAASVTSLTVTWTAPANAGPAITDYDYRHRTTSPEGAWTEVTGTTITTLSATIGSLAENTSYDVQVRATNDEGTGSWSDSGSGRTDANAAPTFSSDATFDAAENQTVAGTVLATDSDTGDDVTGYEITGGADDAFFSIGATDGALTFDAAPNYEDAKDQDTGNTYVVVVTATSGAGEREKTATQTITVTVTDVDTEAPGKPDAPAVSAASVTSLTVTWTAPANAGPAITDYDYRHRTTSPEGAWTEVTGTTITTLSATIGSLAENTSYDVQVRATNDEGTGSWSDSGSGRTDANAAPTFSSDATFDAAENQTVAGAVLATDSDAGDDVTGYEITGGADDAFFSIGATDGALTFDAAPNYEDAKDQDTGNTYVVVVTATSGAGEREKTATQTITVTVTDVDTEAPGKPDAPAVSAASVTSLTVTWTAPANAGPAITDYDYRHRTTSPEGAWTEVTGTTITTLSATIGSLAENTSYDVQVRATNDEGTGSWSDSGSGRTDANAAPTFSSDATFDAAENQTVAGAVLATDSDAGDDVTGYEITGGADDAFFSIGATDGALTFDAAPNYEDAKDQDTGNTYVVVVTATSGAGEREKTATQTITVTVTDVDTEAPGKPDAPAVSAASVTSLTVTWTAPANAGPAITDYDYRHRTTSPEGAWTEVTGTTITTLSATIGSLAENTSYDVQVRATNDEGTGSWSDSGSGRTDANAAPTFSSDATFDAAENQTVAGAVLATDSDAGDDVTGYEITGGADDAFFSIGATDGALTFDAAPNYEDAKDQDTGNTYVVVVTATSGAGEREKTATQTITVTVTDVDTEAPGKPDAPAVSAASVTSLTVTWTAPANAGPAITDYDYRHRTTSPEGAWTEVTGTTITTLSATIGSLAENTSYDVQVRATNDEGTGSWSDSGSGRTDANAAPTFSSDATFDAAENQTVAGAVLATDSDAGDDVTGYEITGGADDAFFSIGATDGALTFDAAPNYEDAKDQDTGNTYVVVVTATSGAGEREKTATQTITVTVTDVDTEAPGKPDAPAVSAASVTSLTVTWTAPANAGPAITDYDYRHRTTSPEGAWTEVTGTTITTLSATIGSLAENTSYDVQVRATNDEGTGSWSDSGSGRTDANAAPTFSSDATFDAAENQTVAGAVLATDSDAGDDVTGYEITGGADDAFFSIGATDGALTFDAAPNYEDAKDQDTGNTYVVVVTATSGAGEREKTATQTITVTVTDVDTEAPGKPDAPAVSAASVTSLTVTWTAPANAGPAITDYDYRHRTTSPRARGRR
ncbi:fibronectin type III domain-containing protein [Candidatus Palauibacter sp.]|uniref:fibronectin type III domain-containing protein n=1 Tax=Candidatus Palauibacter sp. TaxID=3101350 RepID=UPI003B59D0E4